MTAIVIAEIMLGKIRPNPNMGEPPYLHRLRRVAMLVNKSLGNDNLATLVKTGQPAVHAFVAMIADKIVSCGHPETMTRLKELSVPHRVTIETLVRNATGGDNREGRWSPELWHMKKVVSEIIETSPSDITAEDIRKGCDDLIHVVVDKLFERWETLIN